MSKKRVLTFFSVSTVFALLLLGCKKESSPLEDCPPDLPCATEYGAHTFGCYVNGVPWVAEVGLDIWDPTVRKIDANYDEPDYGEQYYNIFYFNANKVSSGKYDFFSFTYSPLLEAPKVLTHGGEAFLKFNAEIENSSGETVLYQIDTLSYYNINISKLDKERNFIAGAFHATLVSEDKRDTLVLTQGRFDIKYSPE